MSSFRHFVLLVLFASFVFAQPTEYNVHVNGTESLEFQSLSPTPTPRSKSIGKGTWKAIKIWESGPSDPLASSSSSTSKRASAERVVSSATTPSMDAFPYLVLIALRPLFESF